MGGLEPYAWLGHVAAAPRLRGLLASGSVERKTIIVEAMNRIGALSVPLDCVMLETQLSRLISLGLTMKVWSRFLCITRPDLFCSVSSFPVQKNLSSILDIPASAIEKPATYVRLLQLVHSSPWFNSSAPIPADERAIWQWRVAFMDAIYY